MRITQILLPMAFFAFFSSSFAQKWAFGVSYGAMTYQGDLSKKIISFPDIHGMQGICANYQLSKRLTLQLNYHKGTISGSDMHDERFHSRGFVFSSPIQDIGFDVQRNLFPKTRYDFEGNFHRNITPYYALGMGVYYSDPKTNLTDGFRKDYYAEYNKNGVMVRAGAGVKADLNRHWEVQAEASTHATFSDYLDGISRTANPLNNDWYLTGKVTVLYHFEKKLKDIKLQKLKSAKKTQKASKIRKGQVM